MTKASKLIKLATQQISDRKRKNCESEQDKAKEFAIIKIINPVDWVYGLLVINEDWQRDMCAVMGLRFICANDVSPGGPDIALRHPNIRTLVNTIGDGNCMFRAFSYIITGSQTQ